MPQSKTKRVLTTGDVARICHVAPRTVSKWFDTGKLRGYRIPGSRDRRIPVKNLVEFMRAHGMPMNELDGGVCRVLIVDNEPAEGLARTMSAGGRFEVRVTADGFGAGVLAQEFRPHVLVLDTTGHKNDAGDLCRSIRDAAALEVKVIAADEDADDSACTELTEAGFDAVIAKPLTPTVLAQAIDTVTDLTF